MWATSLTQTKTGRQDKSSATIVLRYKRLDAKTAADETVLPGMVEPAFAKLQGVEVKGSKLDTNAQEIRIRLDGKGGAKLADIKAAFSDRGGRRTHKITRLSTSSLCQFAYPAREVAGPGVAPGMRSL